MAYPILQFFVVDHLSPPLQAVAGPFASLAFDLASRSTAHPAEVAAGLRHLLEAKDCAVRASLPAKEGA